MYSKYGSKDLTNETFGNLTVLKDSSKRNTRGEIIWLCRCVCSKETFRSTSKLNKVKEPSCGCYGNMDIYNKAQERLKELPIKKIKLKKSSKIPLKIKHKILEDFLKGLTLSDLRAKYGHKRHTIRNYLRDTRDKLTETFELRYLQELTENMHLTNNLDKALDSAFLQKELRKRTSPPNSNHLTAQEQVYTWVFFHSSDNKAALKESTLSECLRVQDDLRKNLLGIYLRSKPNIVAYLKELREANVDQANLNKEYIQSELINQVEHLRSLVISNKGSVKERDQLIKSIELLGKTMGAFQDNIKVTQVNPDEALDRLIANAKEIGKDDLL